jgi:acetoin utilization protein AcuB
MVALIRELMSSEPRTVAASATLHEAMRLMDQHDVRHLPVVDAAGTETALAGMVSDRDLLLATGWLRPPAGREHPEAASPRGRMASPAPVEPRLVREVMSSPAATLGPGDRVYDLALRMVTDRIGSVAVVEAGRLVGIATETDLLTFYSTTCARAEGFLRPQDTAARAMSTSPVVVRWSTRLDEAAAAMVQHRLRHLPVVASGEVVGIVSDRDLRRASGRGAAPETVLEGVMTRDVALIAHDASLARAAELMCARGVSSLPVMADRTLVGILTTTDLACYCLERFGAWSQPSA